jgi:hypothetical protein
MNRVAARGTCSNLGGQRPPRFRCDPFGARHFGQGVCAERGINAEILAPVRKRLANGPAVPLVAGQPAAGYGSSTIMGRFAALCPVRPIMIAGKRCCGRVGRRS